MKNQRKYKFKLRTMLVRPSYYSAGSQRQQAVHLNVQSLRI